MAQNIYDQEAFFKEYSQIPRQVGGLAEAPEWPKLSAMLPDLQDLKLLDLGCGFGWVCRWSREQGTVLVEGIDVSKNMLERAKTFPGSKDNAISFKQADLETLKLPSSTYDVVFSSLALHYLQNLPALVQQVYQTLTPGGSFVFSVEHPIFTAPRNPKWIKDSEDKDVWPLDQYLNEGPRTTSWFADGVVKQHRTIATYVSLLMDAGFVLSAIDEWGPTYEQITGGRLDWPLARHRPPSLLVKVTKPQL